MEVRLNRNVTRWLLIFLILSIVQSIFTLWWLFRSQDLQASHTTSELSFYRPPFRASVQNKTDPTSGIGACLLVLEDSIFLKEWLAYHYTTLPLSSLIIAFDPKNSPSSVRRIQDIVRRYEDLKDLHITYWYNDTFIHDDEIRDSIQNYEKNPVKGQNVPYRRIKHLFSRKIKVLPQRERQCQFVTECMKEHKRQGQSYVLLTDPDEYLLLNYVHPQVENMTSVESIFRRKKKKIMDERLARMPTRLSFNKSAWMTMYDFLLQQGSAAKRCYKIVELNFGSREQPHGIVRKLLSSDVIKNVPNLDKLVTVAHRNHNEFRDSRANKVMIDVSRVEERDLHRNNCHTIHNANTVACGKDRINFASGQDYISSIFRINHYVGTFEAYLQRSADYRGRRNQDGYNARVRQFVSPETMDDDDIRPWLNRFVDKVGFEASRTLLE